MAKEFKSSVRFPMKESLDHFNRCDGCDHCDLILEIFGRCVQCGIIIDKQELHYNQLTGDYHCQKCILPPPPNNLFGVKNL